MTAESYPDHLPGLFAEAADRWPDREALVIDWTGQRLTYRQLYRRANAVARQLRERGVEPGDRVGVMMRNRAEFPISWLAIAIARAIMVPVNVFYQEEDAGHLLRHSGAGLVISESEFVPLLRTVQSTADSLRELVILEGAADCETLTADESDPLTGVGRYLPEDLTNIQYTSGSTGKPKGCMLSNRYWARLGRIVIDSAPHLTSDDVLLTAQPFTYMDPQWNLVAACHAGAKLVVLDRFHPSSFWRKVSEHSATFFYCLGAMPALMLEVPESPHDRQHNVRYVGCSGIPTSKHAQLERRFGAPWYEIFGSTETGGDLTVPVDEHDELVGSGCIGRSYPHREVRVVDEDGRPRPRGELGELVIRGHSMMDGYFGNPEATQSALRGGWYHTGDLAWMDEDGRVFFHGRKKDIIRRSGENISAVELEEVLATHPSVGIAACVSVPDDLRGEEVKAYLVGANGVDVDLAALIEHCEQRLAYFKVPRYWEIRSELPMTLSEKIAKGQLVAETDDLRAGAYDRVGGEWR